MLQYAAFIYLFVQSFSVLQLFCTYILQLQSHTKNSYSHRVQEFSRFFSAAHLLHQTVSSHISTSLLVQFAHVFFKHFYLQPAKTLKGWFSSFEVGRSTEWSQTVIFMFLLLRSFLITSENKGLNGCLQVAQRRDFQIFKVKLKWANLKIYCDHHVFIYLFNYLP